MNTLSRYLGTVDSYYGTTFLFKEEYWKEQLECGDGMEIMSKIQNYVMEASNTIQLQIAEAMLSYKEKRLANNICIFYRCIHFPYLRIFFFFQFRR